MSVEVRLERVAHGGYVVGRADGKVVFVTGGLPGERVLVDITEVGKRFDRARVVEVLDPADGRVVPPCPIADRCGGCDWQHADQATQLKLKAAVVTEQLQRLAGIDWNGEVEAAPGGLTGWRTRVRYAVDEAGRVGFRARRSHQIVALPEGGCLIAAPGPSVAELTMHARPGGELEVTVGEDRTVLATLPGEVRQATVRQRVRGRTYEVAPGGFWQVHPESADILTGAVLEGLRPEPGDRVLDLYCGVGLFAGAMVDAGCLVLGAELSREAVSLARRNVPEADFVAGALERGHRDLPEWADLVVLDPPRKGAGAAVVRAIVDRGPRAVAYVACDPAALARDLATFAELGYGSADIRAFDLFPMTHHVECVAILRPQPDAPGQPLD